MLELLCFQKSDFGAEKNFPRKYLNPIVDWPFAFDTVWGVFFYFGQQMTKNDPYPI